MERNGITVAGNIVADLVKSIDVYPKVGMLARVNSVSRSVGGCVPNVGLDLAVIDPKLHLSAAGRVGDDDNGRFILSKLKEAGIDTGRIAVSDGIPTSFSDVMSLPGGERTFFHARGANAVFDPADIDLDGLDCRILHIGYILLLDRFDAPDPECGTVMARFLRDVQARGIETSVDMVSDSTGSFALKAIPALKYTDYFIVNELECCSVWGIEPRLENGDLNAAAIRAAMEKTLAGGVAKKVIVHAKEACFCLSGNGFYTARASLSLPEERIRGSVGAGDAFSAGALYAILNGMSDAELLEFASAAAACSLFSAGAVDGMRSSEEIMELMRTYPRRAL